MIDRMAKKSHLGAIPPTFTHNPLACVLRRFVGRWPAVLASLKPTGLFGFVVLSAMLHGAFYGLLLTMPVTTKVNVKSITLVTFAATKPVVPAPVVAEVAPVPSQDRSRPATVEARVPKPKPLPKPKPVSKPKLVPQPDVAPQPLSLASEMERDLSAGAVSVDFPAKTAGVAEPHTQPQPECVGVGEAGLQGGAAGHPSAMASYVRIIQQRVQGQLRYPLKARKWKMQGTGEYRFVIRSDGSLGNDEVTIIRSSGCTLLDRAAKQTIRRAVPFPKPPVDTLTVTAPIVFELR